MHTLLVVDAANVVGSVPDGWWRDRAGAATRLRDRLAAAVKPDVEVVLVVEGAARGVQTVAGVRVVAAPGSGDDTIVQVVREATGPNPAGPNPAGPNPAGTVTVVTSDRALRARVVALGAKVVGPRAIV